MGTGGRFLVGFAFSDQCSLNTKSVQHQVRLHSFYANPSSLPYNTATSSPSRASKAPPISPSTTGNSRAFADKVDEKPSSAPSASYHLQGRGELMQSSSPPYLQK